MARSTPVIVFLPGFPDDFAAFEGLASKYRATHTVIQTCFPGFDLSVKSVGGGALAQRWGYSFVDVVAMLRETILAVSGEAKVTLVAHDWGAFTAYLFAAAHPELLNAMVTLDVGHVSFLRLSPWYALVICGYQLWLVSCFIVSQLLSSILGDIMMGLYPWSFVGPCPYETVVPRHYREIHSWMCYPYFQLWVGSVLRFFLGRGLPPQPAFPPDLGVPLLYLYGPRKRCLFHTDDFLKRLDCTRQRVGAAGASRWAEVAGAGHWLHTQKPAEVEGHVASFLAACE